MYSAYFRKETAAIHRPAFTLIKLLIVVAIIAILAALLLPVLSRARNSAQRAVCLNNIKQQSVILHLYAQDCNSRLPAVQYNTPWGEDECRYPINSWMWSAGADRPMNWRIVELAGYLSDPRILYDNIDQKKYSGIDAQAAPWGTGANRVVAYELNPYRNYQSTSERVLYMREVPEKYMLIACLFGSGIEDTSHRPNGWNVAFRDGAAHAVRSNDARYVVIAGGGSS